jgi:hypothetical protein
MPAVHPPSAAPPNPRLAAVLAHDDWDYAEALGIVERYERELRRIQLHRSIETEPCWANGSLPGLDGAALYAFVRDRAPARYLEVGSGESTRFVARARADGGLDTTITSIAPANSTHPALFAELRPGDVLFVDGSHLVRRNSDVVTFFLDVLPSLAPGVLVGIHDVYLPYDYPPDVAEGAYGEQYLLGAYLLGTPPARVVLPAYYVAQHPALGPVVDALWADPSFTGVERHGTAFWMTTV